jgi:hypothetical protein
VLRRSTISTIVEVLVADALVEEICEGESTGGRRFDARGADYSDGALSLVLANKFAYGSSL